MSWAAKARATIARTMAALPPGTTVETAREALRKAYPFGPREHHPYKVWLAEVRLVLEGRPKPKAAAHPLTCYDGKPEPVQGQADQIIGYRCARCGWMISEEDARQAGMVTDG